MFQLQNMQGSKLNKSLELLGRISLHGCILFILSLLVDWPVLIKIFNSSHVIIVPWLAVLLAFLIPAHLTMLCFVLESKQVPLFAYYSHWPRGWPSPPSHHPPGLVLPPYLPCVYYHRPGSPVWELSQCSSPLQAGPGSPRNTQETRPLRWTRWTRWS